MGPYAIDTNVAVVANGRDTTEAVECIGAAQNFINGMFTHAGPCVILDSPGFILREYMANLSMSGQPGLGDAFMKWVHSNQANPALCIQVTVTPLDRSGTAFAEFPADASLASFDRSDRKFVAVVVACNRAGAAIVHATDRTWWIHERPLAALGVRVQHLCSRSSAPATG